MTKNEVVLREKDVLICKTNHYVIVQLQLREDLTGK